MNQNTRHIFVNVLVNGNIYKNNLPITTDTRYHFEKQIEDWLIEFGKTEEIPFKFLSYEIVNEVTEKQSQVLSELESFIVASGSAKYLRDGGLNIINGQAYSLKLHLWGIGDLIIYAKDIVIKE